MGKCIEIFRPDTLSLAALHHFRWRIGEIREIAETTVKKRPQTLIFVIVVHLYEELGLLDGEMGLWDQHFYGP